MGSEIAQHCVFARIVVFILASVFLLSGVHVKSEDINGEEELRINREPSYAIRSEAPDTINDSIDCLYYSAGIFPATFHGRAGI